MKGSTSLRLKKFEKKGKEITANVGGLSDIKTPTAKTGSLAGLKTISAKTGGLADIELPTVNSEVAGRLQGATKETYRKRQLEAKRSEVTEDEEGNVEDEELREIRKDLDGKKRLNRELQQKIKYLKRLRGE